MNIAPLLAKLHLEPGALRGGELPVHSPIDVSEIARLPQSAPHDVGTAVARSAEAFEVWRSVPAPVRGELIRRFGDTLRANKEALGELVTVECGKIREEGLGEVQEMIDICDFSVGLSRTLGGLTLPSERPAHVMHENWYPLGVVGVISAFNFPVAVWAWNFAVALVCGDTVVWKPSEKTPLTALACQALFERTVAESGMDGIPPHLSQVVIGGRETGKALVRDTRVALVSATGSVPMGKAVGQDVASRMGRCLLELGGNNAAVVAPAYDPAVALPSIVFGAVGTAGQRCTTTRRLIAHESIYDELTGRLEASFASLRGRIGDPLADGTLIGPLIDRPSYDAMQSALDAARAAGGTVHGGGRVLADRYPDAHYVEPALVRLNEQIPLVHTETFAPILYAMPYRSLDEAIALHNAVPQGLSGAVFTTDLREAEVFRRNAVCGIANVNIGTSGAEIGGAFGGEKETGGGRESGSDSWKQYMRRQTSTIYYGREPPALAQGIRFW
ncbi:MAG: aldehyde dehydrogenase family protein [Opitutales bacterium]|nr:aldehyde dehydrogenase family protein [Opitutales bacterium]